MKIVTRPKVEFLVNHNDIPFKDEIDAIYRGYRQCYTKNPMKPLKPLTLQEQLEFISSIGGYMSYHQELNENLTGYNSDDLIEHLRKCEFIFNHLNHQSPLEHAKLTVRITHLSRAASHQLVRHRLASFSQQSQRYVTENDFIFTLPPKLRNNETIYNKVQQVLAHIEETAKELKQMGVPNEDIRAVFPNATCTELVMTANFRQWLHIFNERCCMTAQAEIRSVAYQVLRYLRTHIPLVFDHAGAKCETLGYCPESEKSACGRYMRKDDLLEQIVTRKIHGKTWVAERNPNVPIPTPVTSLDIERMSACEQRHFEEETAQTRTDIVPPAMQLEFRMMTPVTSSLLNETNDPISNNLSPYDEGYSSVQMTMDRKTINPDSVSWN